MSSIISSAVTQTAFIGNGAISRNLAAGAGSFLDVQHAAFAVYLVKLQAACFRHAKAMPEHHQQQATVAGLVAAIPGWIHTGDPGDALLIKATFPQCCGGTNTAKAGDGDQFVILGGGFDSAGSAAWSQTINGLTIGQTYIVNFLMASEGETPTQRMTVGFTSGSSTPSETFTSIPTSTLFWQNWGSEQYTFVPTATSATLQFSVANQQYDVGLDGVSIVATTVPEPSSVLLVVSAILGLGGAITVKHRLVP